MVDHKAVQEIATEDAAEVLHKLGDDDFINVIGLLIKRRASSYNYYLNIIVLCEKIKSKAFEKV